MKKILIALSLVALSVGAFGQTIEKSQSIVIYDIVPTVAPCTYCSERAFVRADNTEYWWNGTTWEKWYDGNSYLTTLVQDSIIVTTRFGVEVDRDTVKVSGGGGGGSGTVQSIQAGTGISVDASDPANPIVSSTEAGISGLTNSYIPVATSPTRLSNSRLFQDLPNHKVEYRDTSNNAYTDMRILNFDGNTNTDNEGVLITALTNNVDGTQTVRAMGRLSWQKKGAWSSSSTSSVDSKFTLSTIINQNLTTVLETNGSNGAARFPSGIGTIEGNVLIQNGILTGSNTLLAGRVTSAVMGNFASRDFGNRGLLKLQFNNEGAGYSAISGLQTSTYNFSNDRDGGISFYMTRNGVPDRETFIFNEVGQIITGENGVTHTRSYDLNFQTGTKGFKVPVGTTAGRTTGVLGYFNANSTIAGFEGHNGTSFFRFMQQSDITPTDGQIGVWNATSQLYIPTTLSSGTMSSWNIDSDSASPSTVDDGETVSILGDGLGIDTQNSGNSVQVKLDLSEIPAYTTLEGNEFLVNYDVTNGNSLTHIDTFLTYIRSQGVGGGIYGGSGTVRDSAWITLPNSKYWRFESSGDVSANIGNFNVTTPIFGISGNMQYLSALGGGDQKISVSNLGIVSFSSDDRALVSSITAFRPPMYTGNGNEMSSFPLESTLGRVRMTQSTGLELAKGSTALRPSATTEGILRYNTDTDKTEVSNGTDYDNLATENFTFAETYLGYSGNSSSTITPVKSLFIQASIGTGDTYTLTIDDTDVPAGAYMDVFNGGVGDLVLDRSSGNFVTTTGSPATITITDSTARFVFSGSAWYQIH